LDVVQKTQRKKYPHSHNKIFWLHPFHHLLLRVSLMLNAFYLPMTAALDTSSGSLCKTYAWQDDQRRPQGLPLCSELSTRSDQTGDRRAFLGYEYTFDGKSWIRGNTTRSYDPKTGIFSPKSDDPFDPLGILT
jgi:hypothetical protein